MESDEEIRRVPEIGSGDPAGPSASGREAALVAGPDRVQASGDGQRKRGRSPADKENKRLKRWAEPVLFLINMTILPFWILVWG